MHSDFTLGLALYDFLPVVLTGVAVWFLARLVTVQGVPNGGMAFAGAGLVFAAGLSKAMWKLNVTLTGQDVTWLANLLFPLMAPGFVLISVGIWAVERQLRGKQTPSWMWGATATVILAVYVLAFVRMVDPAIQRGWFMPMMGMASVGNIGLTVVLIALSLRNGKWGLAILFLLNLAMVFVLIPIAQIEPKTISLHWIEQTITSGGASAFALASFRLFRLLRTDTPLQADLLPQPSVLSAELSVQPKAGR